MSVVVDHVVRNNLGVFGILDMNSGVLRNPSSIETTGDTMSIITPTTVIDQGNSEVKIKVDAADQLILNANNSTLQVGSSALNLAYLSDGTSAANTTYFAASNAGNTANMSLVMLPDQTLLYQNSGAIQRMTIDADITIKTQTYVASGAGTGAQLMLKDSDGSVYLGNGATYKPRITIDGPDGFGLNLIGYNQAFRRVIDANQDTSLVYSGFVGFNVKRDEIGTNSQRFRDTSNVEQMRIDPTGIRIRSAYTLPTADGAAGASLQTNGAGACSFVAPSPSFSSYARVVVSGFARQTLISASIFGSTTIPANTFVLGSVWRLQAHGTYSVVAAQTIVISILMGGVVVAFTPALSIANSPAPWSSVWVLAVQAVGVAGVARLASGSTNRLDTVVACSNTVDSTNFNTTVANVLDFTSKFSIANADTITCESVSISRIV